MLSLALSSHQSS